MIAFIKRWIASSVKGIIVGGVFFIAIWNIPKIVFTYLGYLSFLMIVIVMVIYIATYLCADPY